MLEVQLDTERGSGVGGFVDVPDGPHRLSLRHDAGGWVHSWCLVAGGRLPVAPEDADVRPRTVPYPPESAERWRALTANLGRHLEVLGLGRPPEGPAGSGVLAAEIERSFIEGFLSPDSGEPSAILRWRRLLGEVGAVKVALGTEAERRGAAELVESVSSVLGHQLELLGADLLDDALVCCLALLGAELRASGDARLVAAGAGLSRLTGG
jgi:hypothetical protein